VDVPIRVQVNGVPRPLPGPTETALLRLGQEALTNAVRHAGASAIRLELSFLDEAVELVISDDGRGFSVEAQEGRTGHLGLHGMRERARALGLPLEIQSAPGQGTRVFVRAPLPPSGRSS
jgi:signal transduction histidine kinase